MTLFKICAFIIFYFVGRVALAADCEMFFGYKVKESLCWDSSIKGYVSAKCLKKCDAKTFFSLKKPQIKIPRPVDGQSLASLICHELELPVIILRDSNDNEQSFCTFKDSSMVDSNAVERHFE
jgi:hypothetical protein